MSEYKQMPEAIRQNMVNIESRLSKELPDGRSVRFNTQERIGVDNVSETVTSALAGLKMPWKIATEADIIIGVGRILKNRHGGVGQFVEGLQPSVEMAMKDGDCIWDSRWV